MSCTRHKYALHKAWRHTHIIANDLNYLQSTKAFKHSDRILHKYNFLLCGAQEISYLPFLPKPEQYLKILTWFNNLE